MPRSVRPVGVVGVTKPHNPKAAQSAPNHRALFNAFQQRHKPCVHKPTSPHRPLAPSRDVLNPNASRDTNHGAHLVHDASCDARRTYGQAHHSHHRAAPFTPGSFDLSGILRAVPTGTLRRTDERTRCCACVAFILHGARALAPPRDDPELAERPKGREGRGAAAGGVGGGGDNTISSSRGCGAVPISCSTTGRAPTRWWTTACREVGRLERCRPTWRRTRSASSGGTPC